MCTIIVRHRMDYWCSTIIAANRDEFYGRKWTGPQVLSEDPHVVGGRDEQQGGSWLGLTADGVFLALTNQASYGARDESLRSRGELVVEALKQGSFDGLKRFLSETDATTYNEFNVMFGDGREVWVGYGRQTAKKIELEALPSGVHVLCNDRLGASAFPKADRVRSQVVPIPRGTWPKMKARLVEILADGTLPPPEDLPPLPPGAPFDDDVARHLQATCIKTPIYGTVSSTIAAVKKGKVVQYAFASGPPGETEFEDFLPLTHPPAG